MQKMKTGFRWRGRIEIGLLGTIAVSILFVILFSGGNPEAFLIDDNRTQWYPVMERAYEDLWETGRIYCYDLYQMKGMSIAQQGYYGIMNPFMLLSFGVTRLLPGNISTITFYIGLMVVLGNMFLYLVLRRLGCGERLSFLMGMTYSTIGCFWAFCYWYYVFNNYLMIPLLLYVFLRCKEGWMTNCAFGVMLAMDLWMGNVQYTCYHYILFGILCMIMMILKRYQYIRILFVNVVVGMGMSAPMLNLLLRASGDFQKQEYFLQYPIFYFSFFIHSVIPQGILQNVGKGVSFLDTVVMGRNDNLVLYMGPVVILLCVFGVKTIYGWLRRICKCRYLREIAEEVRTAYAGMLDWSHEQKAMAAVAAAFLFFMSFMSGGLVAELLYIMPVVRKFRYLFKVIFVVSPLAVILLAWAVKGSTGKIKRMVICLMVLFVCVGIVNARGTVQITNQLFGMRIAGSFAEEREMAVSMIEAADMDVKNYRTVAFFRFAGVHDECFDQARNLTKNFPTALGMFSLSGYEIATEKERLEEFDTIYSDWEFYAKYANADTMNNLYLNLIEYPDEVQRQLIDNSVRYLLLDKTELRDNIIAQNHQGKHMERDLRPEIIAALKELPGIRVVAVKEFNEHYDLVEIDGVNSLCMDDSGERVPLQDPDMQTVTFEAQKAGEYTLSFSYDSHLQAFLTEKDGTKRPLSIVQTENDNILISTQGGCGEVTLTYHDPVCTMGFVWEAVVSLGFVALLAGLGGHRMSKINKE